MDPTYKVLVIGVVYNSEKQFLVATREKSQKHMPGTYSYHVGDLHFDKDEKFEALERSLALEVQDEAGIEVEKPIYLSSHQYEDETGTKVVAVAFLAKYKSGEIRPDNEEVEEVKWMTIDDIDKLDTLPIVHEVYRSADRKLGERQKLHYLSVAGLVLNDNDEFMLVKDETVADDDNPLYTFPVGEVVNLPGSAWEMLARNLEQNLKSEYGVEIRDGAIPFTDQSIASLDDLDGIVEFYIARAKTPVGTDSDSKEILWQKFADFDPNSMRPSTYNVFSLASKFIGKLADDTK